MENTKQLPKLGKLPKKVDPRTLKLISYLNTDQLPELPLSAGWAAKYVGDWGEMGNTTVGDCTCASAGHLEILWTNANGDLFVPTYQEILAAYSAITGYNPADPSTDNGANELDVLKYWRNTGIAGKKISAFIDIDDLTNIDLVKYAVFLFGGCYIGVSLPLAYQGATEWDTLPDLDGNNAPGSWGGHAVPIVAYDADGVTVITWGAPLKMSWGAFAQVCEEAWAVLSPDWFNGEVAPDGFDLTTLQSDLNALNA